ncbi:MAG: YgiT-type zinc finger protein [Armatimonadetes bacterium]|nr:YgiT-type zinc finger protein [Armatimonadota bacterium]
MRCIVCQGDDVEMVDVQEQVRFGSDIVCVPLRTLVCQTCGERYYDRRTMRHLEGIERELDEGKVALRDVGRVLVYG